MQVRNKFSYVEPLRVGILSVIVAGVTPSNPEIASGGQSLLGQNLEMCGNDFMAHSKGHRKGRRDQNDGTCWVLAAFSKAWQGRH